MSSKGIFRLSRRERFAQIDTQGLEDERLSFKAKGVWTYLMSRTDDWTTRVQHLSTVSRDGEKAVRSALDELIEYGYARRRQRRGDDGTYKPVEWWILEAPPEVLSERMPDDEFAEFMEEWKTWPDPEGEGDDEEPSESPDSENKKAVDAPDPQNREAVKKSPDPGNREPVKSPDPRNGEAAETPDPQNREAVDSPDPGLRDAGQRRAENRGLLNNDLRKKETTYDRSGRLVGRSREVEEEESDTETDQPTDRPTAESDTAAYIDWVALHWELDWGGELREDIAEIFSRWDGRAGRAWFEAKMERLAGKYSAIGVADMVRRDILAGECPEPTRRDRLGEEEESYETNGQVPSGGTEAVEEAETIVLEERSDEWGRALLALREMVSRENFEAWFEKIDCGGEVPEGGRFVLLVADEFFRAWIEDHYRDLIEEALERVLGREVDVIMEIANEMEVKRP